MHDTAQRLGRRVRALRMARGLSQDALARLATMDRVFVGEVERGTKAPGFTTLWKLARALGVGLPALLDLGGEADAVEAHEGLGRRVAALALGASRSELARFDGIATAFFGPLRRGRRARRR